MKRLLLPLLAALALPTVLHADHKYPVKDFFTHKSNKLYQASHFIFFCLAAY